MNINDKINKLSYTPHGEAKILFDEFIANPDYTNFESIEKLLVCLAYEKQYDSIIILAKTIIDNYRKSCSIITYLFYAIACDMTGNREAAVWGYKEILKFDCIPPCRFDQLGIKVSREFIEYLTENSLLNSDFVHEHFEKKLQRQLLVKKSPHFNVYYYPDSTAEKEINLIISQREAAYRKISEYLDFADELAINLYFFENGDTKREITGHTGVGWAYGTSMIEVYNDAVKVNPYHELVHVLTDIIYGNTVSVFSEGTAVYLCNLFNDMSAIDDISDAYDKKIKEFHKNGELFPLKDLLSFDIGTTESKPFISYPQAASFVEFTINKLGKSKIFNLYASLGNDYDSDIKEIESVFNQKIEEIEKEWLEWAL